MAFLTRSDRGGFPLMRRGAVRKMTYWLEDSLKACFEPMDKPSRCTSSEPRSGQSSFSRRPRFLVFLASMFSLVQFGYSQTSAPNTSAENMPYRERSDLADVVRKGEVISDCRISGADLANLLIQTEAGTDSAHRLSSGIRVQNAIIEQPVTIIHGEIPLSVTFTDCVFNGDVNFDDAKFLHGLEIVKCHFNGEVTARRMKVGADFVIRGAVFMSQGPVVFSNAQIDGSLVFRNTRFQSEQGVECEQMSVSQDASLSNLKSAGVAHFQRCVIGHQLEIEGCSFDATDNAADFSSITTRDDFLISSCKFSGGTSWDYIHARGLYFSHQTSFTRPIRFTGLVIDRSMSLETVVAGSGVSIENSNILEDLNVTGLTIRSSSGKGNPAQDAAFRLSDTKLGHLKLASATIPGQLALEGDNIGTLDLTNYTPPYSGHNRSKIANLTVDRFEADDSDSRHLLDLINSFEFDPKVYSCLEKFYTSLGDTELADRTFITRNDRFEDSQPRNLGWLGQTLVGILAGYGRDPKRSLIPCLIVVLVGWIAFADKTKMEATEEKFKDRRYNIWYAFWYSLDVFAPIIDLEAAKVWSPASGQTLRWLVFRLERILGWLLVPIAIAAFTGFLHS
jgi:hypothetical protein